MFIVGTAMDATNLKHTGEALCDVVEVRWDKFRVPDEELVKCEKPILLTYRAKEGEYFVKSRADEMKRLLPFVSMVDIDVREVVFGDMVEVINEAKSLGVKVILSAQVDSREPFGSSVDKYTKIVKEYEADYLKLEVAVNNKKFLNRCLIVFGETDVPLILQGTGVYGKESSYIFAKEGSEAIYGHLGIPENDSLPSLYEISQNINKETKKVYLVWKYTDDGENYWPLGLKELLDVYENKEDAIARVKEEKENIKWDVMGMLRVMYQDDALKITEKESQSRYRLYTIEGRYGDIVIELYVEEVMVL